MIFSEKLEPEVLEPNFDEVRTIGHIGDDVRDPARIAVKAPVGELVHVAENGFGLGGQMD